MLLRCGGQRQNLLHLRLLFLVMLLCLLRRLLGLAVNLLPLAAWAGRRPCRRRRSMLLLLLRLLLLLGAPLLFAPTGGAAAACTCRLRQRGLFRLCRCAAAQFGCRLGLCRARCLFALPLVLLLLLLLLQPLVLLLLLAACLIWLACCGWLRLRRRWRSLLRPAAPQRPPAEGSRRRGCFFSGSCLCSGPSCGAAGACTVSWPPPCPAASAGWAGLVSAGWAGACRRAAACLLGCRSAAAGLALALPPCAGTLRRRLLLRWPALARGPACAEAHKAARCPSPSQQKPCQQARHCVCCVGCPLQGGRQQGRALLVGAVWAPAHGPMSGCQMVTKPAYQQPGKYTASAQQPTAAAAVDC